ncbi:MAG TPA: low affinity iron permease family protein [Lacunisphaera sp.]|jgi:low affinity Fe/Cu permease|nr:low affinity iron permease family protein [Lacunisphaera sp.]
MTPPVPVLPQPGKRSRPPPSPAPATPREAFSRFARLIGELTASPVAFVVAVLAVVAWAICGPFAHYSEIWQLWINTSTTILTFLMVFLLQHAQMRDTRAIHVKLDELLHALHGARNELIDLEHFSEADLEHYCDEFKRLHEYYEEAVSRKRTGRAPARPQRPDPPDS